MTVTCWVPPTLICVVFCMGMIFGLLVRDAAAKLLDSDAIFDELSDSIL